MKNWLFGRKRDHRLILYYLKTFTEVVTLYYYSGRTQFPWRQLWESEALFGQRSKGLTEHRKLKLVPDHGSIQRAMLRGGIDDGCVMDLKL